MFSQWLKLSQDMIAAQFEAQHVIGLRLAKIAKGGAAAETESRLMVSEKMAAHAEAAMALGSGQSPETVLRRYRTIMRANVRRLSR